MPDPSDPSPLSMVDLAGLPGAEVVAAGDGQALVGVTADSRAAGPGTVFFALHGVRDGHEFLVGAAASGAAALVVDRADAVETVLSDAASSSPAVVLVPDTLRALQDLATAVRSRSTADAVAITGSVGKTTTKAMMTAALASRPAVHSSPKSFNNHLGVPLTVLGAAPATTDLVAEIGTNHPGEIAGLVRIVAPRVGVVTNVGFAHVGNFGTREELAKEKASLLTGVRADGVWVVNVDDPLLMAAVERGVAPQDAVAGLAALPPLEGRGTVSRARDGRVRVVDDSYNGSPDSVLAALATLEVLPEPRRVAVLGEMRELGEWTTRLHRAVGERVATAATDLVFVGPSFDTVRDAATAAGMGPDRITSAASATEAARVLDALLAEHPDEAAAVLLKASRFVHMERVALSLEGVEVGCTRELCELYIHCRDCPLLLTG